MKKVLIIVTAVIAILIGGTYLTFTIMGKLASTNSAHDVTGPSIVETMSPEKKAETESKEQTQFIGGIQYDTGLTAESSQDAVIDVMHKMTHQKVKAEDKWGAIPMSQDTISQVSEIVSTSTFERKGDLLKILDRWKNGDFSHADDDHNYFWSYQGGTIGKAYGTLNNDEENEFIKNNFK
ncbi:DUF6241 domain-containing protein [Neobacillus sp. OS1-2]|uniref:DUF6241 domain-containing protein n=1 Tax=Neobacillus sp. OS1-2 TaxID=3070680 RepID=UPI0027E0A3F9|nr:DUF6241 domain-containing protein [Neobacillus sp. OS1-2]WML40039.1 DUF6241 domain-containing protein [Neobacillus sp. OS1-2]